MYVKESATNTAGRPPELIKVEESSRWGGRRARLHDIYLTPFFVGVVSCLGVYVRSRYSPGFEIRAPRQQLGVLERNSPRARPRFHDRMFWVLFRRPWPRGAAFGSSSNRDRCCLASGRVPLVEATSITSEVPWQAAGRCRYPGSHPADGRRDSLLGCPENPRPALQARLRRFRARTSAC